MTTLIIIIVYTLVIHFCLSGPAIIKLFSLSVAIKTLLLLPIRIVKSLIFFQWKNLSSTPHTNTTRALVKQRVLKKMPLDGAISTSVHRGAEVNPHQLIAVNPERELRRCSDILFRRDS